MMNELNMMFEKIDRLQDGDILVLAGSIPASLPEDIYERIMARLQEKDIQIVVDATKDLLLNVLKYHPILIKPNNHELGEMFGIVLKDNDEIIKYAKKTSGKRSKKCSRIHGRRWCYFDYRRRRCLCDTLSKR